MISIFTALYAEAKQIIEYFGLKRQNDINRFQFFSNDSVNLLITGTGSINAAIGVTSLCSMHAPASGDILVNIGICGTENLNLSRGTLLLCNKIVDLSTYKTCYPDMLFRHPFTEGTVATSPVPVIKENISADEDKGIVVTDMEASGIFQAGSLFYQPHQMFFLKIVSDYETGDEISREKVISLISANLSPFADWIKQIHDELGDKQSVFSDEETALLEQMSEAMKLTVSMQYQLNRLMQYYKIKHGGFADDLKRFMDENLKEPCKTKNEGKKYFDRLKERFI